MACDRVLQPLEPLSLPYATPSGEVVVQPLTPGRPLTTRFRAKARPVTASGPRLPPGGWRAMRHSGGKPAQGGYDPAAVWAAGGGHSPGCEMVAS